MNYSTPSSSTTTKLNGRPRKQKQKKQKKKEESWWSNAADALVRFGSKIIPMIVGFGDYTVKSNSLLAAGTDGKLGGEVPRLSNSPYHNIVSHREYLGDILSSTSNFSSQPFAINPGLLQTFPWLASLANSYQQYRLKGMVFEFKTLATDYSATPYIGFVAMGTQYDSLDPPFATKIEMDNSEFANSKRTNESFLHPIECARDQTAISEMYVRDGAPPSASSDLRLYDWGLFQIAVGGQATAGVPIGELWVTYEVEFFKPKLASQVGYNANSLFLSKNNVSQTQPLGTSVTSNSGDLNFTTGNVFINFPNLSAGTWLVTYTITGTVAAAVTYPGLTPSGCTASILESSPPSGTSSLSLMRSYQMTVNASSPTLTFGTGAILPTGTVTIDIYVTQIALVNLSSEVFTHVMDKQARIANKKAVDDAMRRNKIPQVSNSVSPIDGRIISAEQYNLLRKLYDLGGVDSAEEST